MVEHGRVKSKSLWQISIATSPESEEMVSALLEEIFSQPASVYFDADKKTSTLSVYLDSFSAKDTRELKRNKALGRYKVRVKKLGREDWAESWKRHFKPLEIGSLLLIKPSWSKRHAKKGQAVVILDPGLSFGTGQHPTTEFCLTQLVKKRTPEVLQSFLDMGTGSGILAIAAAKLGYSPIHAFDFDPDAVRIAKTNAKANRVLEKISFAEADLTKLPTKATRKFDSVCANLISNLLIEQRDKILMRLKQNGVLVLAGILKKEFGVVQKSYESAGLKLISSRAQKEWRSGAFRFTDSARKNS